MPLAPLLMTPAYRYGKLTPWGGGRLKELYNKDTPDPHTGESLELSTIPGLNSTDHEGTPLSALIVRYGKALTGTEVKGEFPLLLKLLDAREALSVQVHPDDAYARKHENKLGKTEAWIILDAQPGAQLVYGIREGVSREMLRLASEQGRRVEELLRYVPVTPGEAYYIPAGTVHAIGAGIVLYEIQQSSDVTYRFYDWERRDQHGNKRTLHLKQAIDVCDPDTRLDKVTPIDMVLSGAGRRQRLLSTPFFETERYTACQAAQLRSDRRRFAVLTALKPALLRWGEDKTLPVPAGQSALLPANGEDLLLHGEDCLYSCPAVR
ncbi:MAG: type I phosphomannose isomerase catalytic subunit [Christensenellales bacterium]